MSLKLQVDRLVSDRSGAAHFKLQLGCGANILPGWLNTDSAPSPGVDYLDFTRPFPFSNDGFVGVFCEHTIEHISKQEAVRMIGEVFRVLRPGGLFRIVTPGLENFCRLALDPSSATAQRYLAFFRRYTGNAQASITDAVNLIFYGHGHKHIYTADELVGILQHAGFAAIRVMPAGTHGNEMFRGVDGHGRIVGEDINAIEAMAIEAAKP